jgi:hypothetical protein
MASEADDHRLREIIASFPQTPGQALEQLKPMAAEGNVRAIVLLAYGFLHQGDAVDEGLPFARQAVERGVGAVAQTYAIDLTNRGREDLRAQAPSFVVAAIESGWTVDMRNLFAQALSQGNVDSVFEAVNLVLGPPPPTPARQQWEELVAKAQSDVVHIGDAAAAVDGQREVAFQQIAEGISMAREKGAAIERLANDLGVLANKAGAETRRKEVLADLALRFFPGQGSTDGTSSNVTHEPNSVQLNSEQLLGILMQLIQNGPRSPSPRVVESPPPQQV